MRSGWWAALAAVAVVACSSGPATDSATTAVTTTSTSSTTTTLPTLQILDDGTPVVTMHFTCYGECAYLWPADLPQVAVYADGTVVAASFPQGQGDPPLILMTGHVSAEQVQALALAATEAGLHGLGRLPNSKPPDDMSFADGGGTVFTYRSGTAVAVREVEYLWDGESFNTTGERGRLLALQQMLLAVADAATDPLPITQWAVVFKAQPIVNPVPDWTGPDLSTLSGQTFAGGFQCTLLTGSAWSLEALDTYDQYYASGGSTWFVSTRPLLPHEHGCGDVAAWWTTTVE